MNEFQNQPEFRAYIQELSEAANRLADQLGELNRILLGAIAEAREEAKDE